MIEIGEQIGALTILELAPERSKGHKIYICRCTCGEMVKKRADVLNRFKVSKHPIACGCGRGKGRRTNRYYFREYDDIINSNMYIYHHHSYGYKVEINVNGKKIYRYFNDEATARAFRDHILKQIYKK